MFPQVGCDACVSPLAERFRRALFGYDNLPPKREKQHLRIYVHHNHDRRKLYLGGSEFQSPLNLLPMATVCTEARVHAATVCRTNIQSMDLCYAVDPPSAHNCGGMEILQPILSQQTTATITTAYKDKDGPKGFGSAKHLMDTVYRVFGGGVKRIVLTS
jgi:ribosomal protein L40E